MFIQSLVLSIFVSLAITIEPVSCQFHSNYLRHDGGYCTEIPLWQHQYVDLEVHLTALRYKWNYTFDTEGLRVSSRTLMNSEISRYMETVLTPFLDTYHRNIQSSYQQLTDKILRIIKEEINSAIRRKQQIYTELKDLADYLNVPAMCNEERRSARDIASKHVASIYACTEEARISISNMGNYAEEITRITRNHMKATLLDATRALEYTRSQRSVLEKSDVGACLQNLSRAAVLLGYELDISLTNSRRHNEYSCKKLTSCTNKAGKNTDVAASNLKDQLYQCVYA